MIMPSRLTLDSSLPDLDRLHEWLDQFVIAHGLTPELCHAFKLALEELVTNVIIHGHRQQPGHRIQVEMAVVEEEVVARITDEAPCFDPLQAKAPDFSVPAHQRNPGGLGIHLARIMMDQLEFERLEGFNQLTLRKKNTKSGQILGEKTSPIKKI